MSKKEKAENVFLFLTFFAILRSFRSLRSVRMTDAASLGQNDRMRILAYLSRRIFSP